MKLKEIIYYHWKKHYLLDSNGDTDSFWMFSSEGVCDELVWWNSSEYNNILLLKVLKWTELLKSIDVKVQNILMFNLLWKHYLSMPTELHN